MTRLEFFLKALEAQEYRRTAWVISAFSLVLEGPNDWQKDPYPYRIVQLPSGFQYVDPEKNLQLSPITDALPGTPLFSMKEVVDVKAGAVPNLFEDVTTTYGRLLFNCIALVYPFGTKIKYQNTRVNTSKIEEMIVDRLRDNPQDPSEREDRYIYVDEYLKFTDAMFSLMAYTQLCVPACTKKTMTAPPGIVELRTRLLEENKDRLHDPSVIARIDAELVQYLKDWMKGDEGMNFLINNKSFNVVRRKLFLMGGAEAGLDDNIEMDLVTKSLSEGWDPEKFATMASVSRAGSFNRGAQTQLGGEAVKWLFRASSNMTIKAEDCGSTLGVDIIAQPGEERRLVGFTALIEGKPVKITNDNVGEYLGKRVITRSPMYCRLPKTDFCATCLGDRLATSPTGLSTAVAEYGSAFLGLFLKSMHSSSLELAKVDYKAVIV